VSEAHDLPASFTHEALLYDGEDDLLAQLVPTIRRAAEAGDPVLVVMAEPRLVRLRHALERAADRIETADMAVLGRNPGRIISAWQDFVARHAAHGGPLLGVGEPIGPDRNADELEECHRHEALLNVAFGAGRRWHLVCPYDRSALAADVVERAGCTHPVLVSDGCRTPGTAEMADPFAGHLGEPDGPLRELAFDGRRLAEVRRFVGWAGFEAGLTARRVTELVLVVSELAANSVIHGGGRGRLRTWRDGDRLAVEIRDRGTIRNPLTGRLRAMGERGRGVWLANQLCDLVQIRSGSGETVIRVQVATGEPPQAA
jgi:anti-sigma regulatory factor (Ser/Thr protein kinase)